MRKLLVRNLDSLQIVSEDGDTVFGMPLPEWCKDREGLIVICELGDIPENVDLEKTCIEALRSHIRNKW